MLLLLLVLVACSNGQTGQTFEFTTTPASFSSANSSTDTGLLHPPDWQAISNNFIEFYPEYRGIAEAADDLLFELNDAAIDFFNSSELNTPAGKNLLANPIITRIIDVFSDFDLAALLSTTAGFLSSGTGGGFAVPLPTLFPPINLFDPAKPGPTSPPRRDPLSYASEMTPAFVVTLFNFLAKTPALWTLLPFPLNEVSADQASKVAATMNELVKLNANVTTPELYGSISKVGVTFAFVGNLLAQVPVDLYKPANVSGQCWDETTHTLRSLFLGRRWALEVFDANFKIPHGILEGKVSFLGDFDQCHKVKSKYYSDDQLGSSPSIAQEGFRTKYCNNVVKFPSVPGLPFPPDTFLRLGTCLPASCSSWEINQILKVTGLPAQSTVCWNDAPINNGEFQKDTYAITVTAVIGLFCGLVVLATCIDGFTRPGEDNFESDTKPKIGDPVDKPPPEKETKLGYDGFSAAAIQMDEQFEMKEFPPPPPELTTDGEDDNDSDCSPPPSAASPDHSTSNDTDTIAASTSGSASSAGKPALSSDDSACTPSFSGSQTLAEKRMLEMTEISNGSPMKNVFEGDKYVVIEKEDSDKEVERKAQPQSSRKSIGRMLLDSFSLYTNLATIMNTEEKRGTVKGIDCIWFLSISWIVLGHTYVFLGQIVPNSTANPMTGFRISQTFTFRAVHASPFAVDTFFLLSGLLVTYLLLKQLKKTGLRAQTMVLYYVHRIFRLTPYYLFFILVSGAYDRYMGNGPAAVGRWMVENMGPCRTNWWNNILYINNFYSVTDMCITVSWYLANDMQFYILAPLVVIPLFYRPRFGALLIAAGLITHVTTNIYLFATIKGVNVGGMFALFEVAYIKPYTRVGSYLIGMILGYALHKQWKVKKPLFIAAAWVFSLALIATASILPYDITKEPIGSTYMWPTEFNAFFESVSKLAFTSGLAWIIYALNNNLAGGMSHIFNWRGWTPLSRLTFGVYLIHPILMSWYNSYVQDLRQIDNISMPCLFVAFLTFSYVGALLTSLVFEQTFAGLEKVFLRVAGLR